ncbi:MAG: GspH/FimT family protein [Rhodocyclales bacterium]|nr:GspH/FimT family protein [Rhodocyclales bacterium]
MVELVIVLVVVSMLFLVGLPSFMNYMAGFKVRSVSEGLIGAVQLARIEAAKRNQPVRFVLDDPDGGGWSVLAADDTVLQSRGADEGGNVQVTVTPAGAGTLVFNSLGQRSVPDANSGLVTLAVTNPASGACQPSGGVRCLSIVVESGGQSRMCDPQRPNGDPQACDI